MKKIIVADAGPLIGLARIGSLYLLQRLYKSVLIPPKILEEIKISSNKPGARAIADAIHSGWIKITKIKVKDWPTHRKRGKRSG